jgi:hypothetical protein
MNFLQHGFRMFVAANVGAILFFCTQSPAKSNACTIRTPVLCQDANQFVNAGGYKEIKDFLGDEPGVTAKSKAFEDMERVLDGPPLDRTDLPGDLSLFSACQAHNCDEKGAVVTRRDGAIIGTGILHYPDYPTAVLTVFIRDPKNRVFVEPVLTGWAQTQLDAAHLLTNEPKQAISNVEFRVLGSSH